MGSRRHGTWCQMHEDVHDHEKTLRLAASLVRLGVPEAWASDVAVAQLHRLACWAARDGNTGRVGHLTDTRFAQVVRWPRGAPPKLRAAWRDSLFFDEPGTPNERIHDFGDYFWHILRKRKEIDDAAPQEPPPDEKPAPDGRPNGAATAQERRPSGDGSAPSHAGARDRAGTRAFRKSESPDTGTHTHTDLEAVAGSADARGVCAEDDAPDGDAALLAAWNAGRRSRHLAPQQCFPDHEAAFRSLRDATGGDAQLARAVIAEFFRQSDQFISDAGWSVKVFPHRLDAALVEARRRKPAAPTGEPPLVLPRVTGASAAELRPYARRADQPFTREEEERIGAEIRAARGELPPAAPRTSWRPPVAVEGGPPDVREDAAP